MISNNAVLNLLNHPGMADYSVRLLKYFTVLKYLLGMYDKNVIVYLVV